MTASYNLSQLGSHYNQGGTGAVDRTTASKLQESVSVLDFGADPTGSSDSTTAIQNALNYVATTNGRLRIPVGIYVVSSTLTLTGVAASGTAKSIVIEGDGYLADASPAQTIIKWGGSSSSSNILFNANGVGKLVISNLGFNGNSAVGTIFQATQSGTTFAPYGWVFTNVGFFSTTASGKCFTVLTTTNMARFQFNSCTFTSATSTGWGFYTANQNSVDHTFSNCSFNYNGTGIGIDGGSFTAIRCEFTNSAVADCYYTIGNPLQFIGCWFEQSNQVLNTDFRTLTSSVTFIGCLIASFPWAYWKLGPEGSRTQPTNDYSQWVAIRYDGQRGNLSIIDTVFFDPFNGAVTGSIAPTTASLITVNCPNGYGSGPSTFTSIGSQSQSAANTFTDQFFASTIYSLAPLTVSKRNYYQFGNSGAGLTFNASWYSTVAFTAVGNNPITITSTNSRIGDTVTIQMTQGGSGGYTVSFTNAKVAGGSWTPTSTVGAVSNITLQYNGTYWYEISRSLALA